MNHCPAAVVLALLLGAPAAAQVAPTATAHAASAPVARVVPERITLPRIVAAPAAVQLAPAAAAAGHADVAPVPIVLPNPPPITSGVTSNLLSALLAIAQARQVDPQAAQTASFEYVKAIQQYRSGDVAGANRTALQALSTAGTAQVRPVAPAMPAPRLAAAPELRPGLGGGLYGADAPAIDADSFLALARGTLDDCAARHDRRLAAARASYTAAERDFAAHRWEATRLDAKAAIDTCAKPQP